MYKVGSHKSKIYSKVEYDNNGFADADKYLPADYDLCEIKVEGKKKPLKGWHCSSWDGLNLEKNMKVISWRRTREILGVY